LIFYRLDVAYSEVGENDTSFGGGRSPRYFGTFVALCPTPDMLPAERDWIRALFDALRPHMLGGGTYVNVLTEQDDARIRETYGAKFERLQMIKNKYDPKNVFHRNANIRPLVAAGS
jgi:hypothetical protein